MKDACSGGSEDEELPDEKEPSDLVNQANGNRLNGKEENVHSEAGGTIIPCPAVDEGSGSNDNDDSEIIIIKEEKRKRTIGAGRNKPGRRSSSRLQGKRPKLTEIITTSDEEENVESGKDFFVKEEEKKNRKKPDLAKGNKDHSKSTKNNSEPKSPSKAVKNERKRKKTNDTATKVVQEFSSGAFVVLKIDFHSMMTPPIWKIDGKALLQKYVHFDQEGQTLYKSTSTYSGWTTSNKDQYYPAEVQTKSQNRKETIVKFIKDTIIADDSD